jgi:hypothetical protein
MQHFYGHVREWHFFLEKGLKNFFVDEASYICARKYVLSKALAPLKKRLRARAKSGKKPRERF